MRRRIRGARENSSPQLGSAPFARSCSLQYNPTDEKHPIQIGISDSVTASSKWAAEWKARDLKLSPTWWISLAGRRKGQIARESHTPFPPSPSSFAVAPRPEVSKKNHLCKLTFILRFRQVRQPVLVRRLIS